MHLALRIPIVVAVLSATAHGDDLDGADAHLAQAMSLSAGGDHHGAIRALHAALALAPRQHHLLFNLGLAYYKAARAGRWSSVDDMRCARGYFERFLASEPGTPERPWIETKIAALKERIDAAAGAGPRVPAPPPARPQAPERSRLRPTVAAPAAPVVAPAVDGTRVAALGSTARVTDDKEATFALHYGRALRRAGEGDHHGALAEAEAAHAAAPRPEALRLIAEQQEQYCPEYGQGKTEVTIDCYRRTIARLREYAAAQPGEKAAIEKRIAAVEKQIRRVREEAERAAGEREERAYQTYLGVGIGAAAAGAGALILGAVLKLNADAIADVVVSGVTVDNPTQNALLLESMRGLDSVSGVAIVAGTLLAIGAGYSFWQAATHRRKIHLTPVVSSTDLGIRLGGSF